MPECIVKNNKLYDIGIIININIGMLYNNFGEYRQAEKYLEQAYDLLQKNKEIPEYYSYLLNIYIGLGNSCFYQEEYMQAQEYALAGQKRVWQWTSGRVRADCLCLL